MWGWWGLFFFNESKAWKSVLDTFVYQSDSNNLKTKIHTDHLRKKISITGTHFLGDSRRKSKIILYTEKVKKIKITFLDNHKSKNTQIGINNASSYWLAFTLTRTSWAVAGMIFVKQEPNSSCGEDTLFHGESLLVIATTNSDNISLKKKKDKCYITYIVIFIFKWVQFDQYLDAKINTWIET